MIVSAHNVKGISLKRNGIGAFRFIICDNGADSSLIHGDVLICPATIPGFATKYDIEEYVDGAREKFIYIWINPIREGGKIYKFKLTKH